MQSKKESKVTIIVTAYHVEEYLWACLLSIKMQDYKNFEALLVIASNDKNCLRIGKEYENVDPRFKVLPAYPKGLSDARNIGILNSTGEFITFVDGDDCLDNKMLSSLMKCMHYDIDIAICHYLIYDGKQEKYVKNHCNNVMIISGKEALKHFFTGRDISVVVAWGKVYRKNLFTHFNIEYPVGKLHEDNLTTYKLLYHAKKIAVLDSPYYHYLFRKDSLSNQCNIQKERCVIESIEEVYQYTKEMKELKPYIAAYSISITISYLLKLMKTTSSKEEYQKIIMFLKDQHVWKLKEVRIRMKVAVLVITTFPKLFFLLLKRRATCQKI